ncbi:MAG: CoA pyrophosphatase [Dokdonella sp.]
MSGPLHSIDALTRVRNALRSIADPPSPPGWNSADLTDLFEPGQVMRSAAVLVPIIERGAGPSVLFTRRTDDLRHHAGQVSFPGGQSDPDDVDASATALRELHEETGITQEFVDPIGWLDSFDTVSGFCVTPLVATVRSGFKLTPDPVEVAEIFEVPLEYILAPDRLQKHSLQWRGRLREIVEFDYQGNRVWGATAAILQNLIQRMEKLP